MADYIRMKGIFYPLTSKNCKDLNISSLSSLQDATVCGEITKSNDQFEILPMVDVEGDSDTRYYLVYMLNKRAIDTFGEFGKTRSLSNKETLKYSDLFSEIISGINDDLLKYIDCCYYNCDDCPDFYINDNFEEDDC